MADEEAVKMTALKKAYAEIILNASKEAAARIMVADRKALCLEQDLYALKEESLHMLLRLKQMLDSKVAEAQVKSLSQQEKIEELEAQLSEAEGIIVDLREELRHVQDALERAKYKQDVPLVDHGTRKEDTNINALEDNVEKELPLDDQVIAETGSGRCLAAYSVSDSPTQPPDMMGFEVTKPHSGELVTSFLFPKASDDQVKSCKELCSPSPSDSYEMSGKISEEHHVEQMDDDKCRSHSTRARSRRPSKNVKYREAIAALRRCSRGPRAKSSQPRLLSRCSTFSANQELKFEANGFHSRSRSHDSTLEVERNQLHDIPSDTLVLHKQDSEGGKARAPSCDVDPLLEESNLHSVEVTEERVEEVTSDHADENKDVKCNPQRKRKEALARLDDNIVPKMNSVKRRALEDQRDVSLMNKSILKDKPSKDSRQLLQIARQLVTLSRNKR